MIRRSALGAVFVLAACGTGSDGSIESDTAPIPTVAGVGYLPDEIPTSTLDPDAEIVPDVVVTRPVDGDGVVVEQVAALVGGNRVIAIGDSILASTERRFGGEMCEAIVPLGWEIEVNAEPGRFVEFGNRVLDRRLPDDVDDEDDWDAAIVHLGSNYRQDQEEYRAELDEILSRLAPRPTLLMTVTVYRPAWAEVNEVIDELADEYDNVIVLDWERTARTPGVLSRDGLHPGNAGEEVLVELIGAALGELPGAQGDCLRSQFTDDSQVGGRSGGSSSGGSSGTSSRGSSGGSWRPSSGGSSSGSTSGGTSGGTTATTPTTLAGTSTGGTDGGTTGGTDGTDSGTDGGTTGGTDDGTSTGGTDGGTTGGTDDGTTGGTDGGSTTGGTDDGSTTGGTDGGSTTGGADDGSTSGGADGGSSTGGADDGSTSGGADGGSSTGGADDGSSTGGAEPPPATDPPPPPATDPPKDKDQ